MRGMNRDAKMLTALGKTLRVARSNPEHPVTLEVVAEAVGCTKSHLSNVERGRSSPEFMLVQRVAKALKIPFLEFVARFEERYRSLSPAKTKTKRTAQ